MIYICYHFTCGCRRVFGGIYFPLVKFLLVCVSFVGVLCLNYELYHVILFLLVYFNMYKECLKIVKGSVRTRFIAVAVPCVDYYAT